MNGPTPVERDETARVQFVPGADEVGDIGRVWQELEAAVGSLRGRHFLGTFDVAAGEYRACVEMREGDAPVAGLEHGTVAGGRYLRTRLVGEPPGLYERIGPAFEELARRATPDSTRPSLELYRRHDQVDLLLPIL
jgi:hypothetical protein